MDANQKPQMTREMMIRLSGSLRRSIDGFKAYGATGRSLKANRKVNSERQYIQIRNLEVKRILKTLLARGR